MHPRSFPGLRLSLLLGLLSVSGEAAPDKLPVHATPEAAAADPDFALQGEYAGSYTASEGGKRYVGVQIIALGEGRFRAVGFEGGLPGAGWDGETPTVAEAGRDDAGRVVFVEPEHGARAVLAGGGLDIRSADDAVLGALKRVERRSPTLGSEPPEGALVLFDGGTLEHLAPGARRSEDGLLMEGVKTARGDFRDFTLHIEFRLPFKPKGRGQARGNSGLYLLGTEIQMLDSFGLAGEANECGGIYSWRRPDVNMCLPPLAWQTYDVNYTAGREGRPGRMTVRHNGVVIHDDVALRRSPEQGGLSLQDHGNPVRYRNLWLVERGEE